APCGKSVIRSKRSVALLDGINKTVNGVRTCNCGNAAGSLSSNELTQSKGGRVDLLLSISALRYV
ncbi:MAG: hypothetical protein ACREDR_07820, partial [Blastocatellia bacterium]